MAQASFRKASGQINLTAGSKKKTASILPPLCKAFGSTFLFGALLKLVQDLMTFANPLILQ